MKRRLSASIDDEVLAAAEAAVREGRAPSLSALVEEALARQEAHAIRMRAMDGFIAAYEEEFGAFEPGEAETLASGLRASVRSAASILAEPMENAA